MDVKTGRIYPSLDAGIKAIAKELRTEGVKAKEAKEQARARLVTGPKPTLRKLKKMIRAQLKREQEARHG